MWVMEMKFCLADEQHRANYLMFVSINEGRIDNVKDISAFQMQLKALSSLFWLGFLLF